jgi:hypothetical protein
MRRIVHHAATSIRRTCERPSNQQTQLISAKVILRINRLTQGG